MQQRFEAEHVLVRVGQRRRAVPDNGAVPSRLKEPAVKWVLENIEGVDEHAAAEIVLAKAEGGGIVQVGRIYVHDE